MTDSRGRIAKDQEVYFSSLFKDFGDSPQAVSSESDEHKLLRYRLLSEVFGDEEDFSVHDVGMGLGHFLRFLINEKPNLRAKYSGTDIVPEYYEYCKMMYPDNRFYLRNIEESAIGKDEAYDFVILSGVFHQMRSARHKDWTNYMENLVSRSFELSRCGVAFNVPSAFSDFYRPGVFYADIGKICDFINKDLSRFFDVKHAYALFEATFFVYKESYVRKRYKGEGFQKYFSSN